MRDDQKTKAELLQELDSFRERVSELKQAKEKLHKSEQRYRSLTDDILDSSKVGIFILDDSFKVVWVNQALERYFGLRKEDVIGKDKRQLIRKQIKDIFEEPETFVEKVFATYDNNTYIENFECHVLADGQRENRWLEHWSLPIRSGLFAGGRIEHYTDITERKKAQEALWLKNVAIESSLQGFAFIDTEGNVTYVNESFLKLWGYSDGQQVLGKPAVGFWADPDKAAEIIEIVHNRGGWTGQLFAKRNDGSIFNVELSASLVKDENADPVCIMVSFIDITERKRAEEAYRSLVDHSLQGLTIFQDGRIVFANQAMADITGHTVEEMLASPSEQVQAFVHPDYRELVWSRHRDRLNGGELPERYEFRGIRKDGSICWLEIHASWIEFQGKPAIQAAYVDITESKKAEEALRDSESKYRTLVENLPQKIFLKDKNSVYVSCNDNLAKDLKIRSEEITGKTDYDFFPKALADKYRADDKRIIELGETKAIEEKYIEDGEERIIHTVKTPVKDEQGNTIGVLGIFWDITELKRREEELNIYREKMFRAEQLASVGTLSASLAHELTQPLTVISLSIANSLAELEKTSCPDTVVKDLKEGLSEVSSIASIVNRFRNFARRSSEMKVVEVDLKAIAERTVKLLDENALRAKVTLRIEGMDKLPVIYSYKNELERLFYCLVENAIQAADGKKSRQVIISGAVIDEHIELQLSDNCGGIAPENLDKIFKPFFTTKSVAERTGLGLCVVERIVSRLGGKVRVESKLGKGSTFFVTLPIKGEER